MNITNVWGLDLTKESLVLEDTEIPISDLDGEIRMYLPLTYKRKFDCIGRDLNLDPKRTLLLLIDIFYLQEADSLSKLKKFISIRIQNGVDLIFIAALKSLYFYLGHLLKKLNQI
jgi:hypothetical protein